MIKLKKIAAFLMGLSAFLLPLFVSAQTTNPNAGFWCTPGSAPGQTASSPVKVPCFLQGGLAGAGNYGDLVLAVIQILLLVVGSLSVLFLIIGGIRYVTAYGNEENAEAAKKTMTHAVIGLTIVILSFAIITIITDVLLTGQIQ